MRRCGNEVLMDRVDQPDVNRNNDDDDDWICFVSLEIVVVVVVVSLSSSIYKFDVEQR
jgi:hypothetical protein